MQGKWPLKTFAFPRLHYYIKETSTKKILSRLVDFGCKGGGGKKFSESVKEGKFVTKIYLAGNVE